MVVGDPTCPQTLKLALSGVKAIMISPRALVDADAVHTRHSYVLTGPQSLSQRDKLRIIGEAIGKEVPWQEIAPEQLRLALLAQGGARRCARPHNRLLGQSRRTSESDNVRGGATAGSSRADFCRLGR